MTELGLPESLSAFLTTGRQLEYDAALIEPGWVGLKQASELSRGVVWITSDESPLLEDDPHAGADGYYEVPAVSLSNECEAYEPDFILLWLPNEKLFGSWDSDHWDLLVFPKAKWGDIVANPGPYLDAQWSDQDRTLSGYFKPYPYYRFKTGMPF